MRRPNFFGFGKSRPVAESEVYQTLYPEVGAATAQAMTETARQYRSPLSEQGAEEVVSAHRWRLSGGQSERRLAERLRGRRPNSEPRVGVITSPYQECICPCGTPLYTGMEVVFNAQGYACCCETCAR